jgi:ribosome-associated protein
VTCPAPGPLRRIIKEDNDLSLETSAAWTALQEPAARAAKKDAGLMAGVAQATSETLLRAVLASLDDDKAEEVVQIDLRGKSEIGDYMVIASGRSTRQVAAIADNLTDRLKAEFGLVSKVEGKDTGDWVLIDAGDVIVHVFRPEVREFYQLEKMWMPGGFAASSSATIPG